MRIFWDLETYLIGPGNIAPKPVCVSFSALEGAEPEEDAVEGLHATVEAEFDEIIEEALANHSVGHNIAFDMAVIVAHRPQFADAVFRAYEEGRVTDTGIREKLLALAETGDLEFYSAPDGTKVRRGYSLSDLEKFYLGIDRSALKSGSNDIWRLNYASLDGMPASAYPAEAYTYAFDDARNTRRIWQAQEERAGPRRTFGDSGKSLPHAFTTEAFQAQAAFALHLQTCWGFALNQERVRKRMAEMAEKFHDSNFNLLLQHGILRPAQPPRPHARMVKKALELNGGSDRWDIPALEAQGIQFVKGKPASIDTGQLHAVVRETCLRHGIEVPRTSDDPDANVSFAAEAQEQLKGLSQVLDQYIARIDIAKLVTTELPRLAEASVIHPNYDVLKETGRTSSYGSRKGRPAIYPSTNIQQVDPRVRDCFVARPGFVLCSVDYDYLELVSLAQKCETLFGQSVLGDSINAGIDPHAFLGSALALRFDPVFQASVRAANLQTREEVYEAFQRLKDLDEERYTHYRTFAKPTGLGFPGGLGARTFVAYARATYGVDLVKMAGGEEEAVDLAASIRAVWFETYPEMKAYFDWITRECKDLDFCDEEGDKYTYISPFGMIRRNCSFTAAANGAALQTPASEGAKLACWTLAKACHWPAFGSSLLGCHPVAFIHDQIIAEIPHDEWMHERGWEMARLMREAMQQVIPDISIGAKPVLMLEWDKKAKTVVDQGGRLSIWKPKPKN